MWLSQESECLSRKWIILEEPKCYILNQQIKKNKLFDEHSDDTEFVFIVKLD